MPLLRRERKRERERAVHVRRLPPECLPSFDSLERQRPSGGRDLSDDVQCARVGRVLVLKLWPDQTARQSRSGRGACAYTTRLGRTMILTPSNGVTMSDSVAPADIPVRTEIP